MVRESEQTLTDALRRAIEEALAKGGTFLGLERETGVRRQGLMKFARGEQLLRGDAYDKLAAYFGLELKPKLIREAPHTHFDGALPKDLAFLQGGFVDLGFENLDLPKPEYEALSRAFAQLGVKVPGSSLKLRFSGMRGATVVEPVQGEEIAMPSYWKQGVYVLDKENRFTWIGKRVRPDQIGKVDYSLYRDVGDGWELIQ